jgi:hypothetical protein
VPRENACVRNESGIQARASADGFTPTREHYRHFVLTRRALVIGFVLGQVGGPPCGRVSVSVPYAVIDAQLNGLGKALRDAVRHVASSG